MGNTGRCTCDHGMAIVYHAVERRHYLLMRSDMKHVGIHFARYTFGRHIDWHTHAFGKLEGCVTGIVQETIVVKEEIDIVHKARRQSEEFAKQWNDIVPKLNVEERVVEYPFNYEQDLVVEV